MTKHLLQQKFGEEFANYVRPKYFPLALKLLKKESKFLKKLPDLKRTSDIDCLCVRPMEYLEEVEK